jgi:hypothetical protein
MNSSLPKLLQEWSDWYRSNFTDIPPDELEKADPTSLLGRTQAALERHKRSVEFYEKSWEVYSQHGKDYFRNFM